MFAVFQCFERHSSLFTYTSVEYHAITVTDNTEIYFVVIYLPPVKLGNFLEELDMLLSSVLGGWCSAGTVVFGDFNIHLDKPQASDFLALLASFCLTIKAQPRNTQSNQTNLILIHSSITNKHFYCITFF